MFNSTNNKPTILKVAVTATFIAALTCAPLAIAQEHEHGSDAAASKEVTGEVVASLVGPSASRAVGRSVL